MVEPLVDPYVTNAGPPPPSNQALRIVAGAVLGAVLAGSLVFFLRPPSLSLLPPPSTTHTEIAPTPNVLLSIQNLAKLEATTFHMERVIDLADKQSHLFGLVEGKDNILLIAVGEVVAGTDLGGIQEDDVEADFEKKTITVRLPAPKVIATRLDEKQTKVYARKTDALAVRHEDLEERARREAVKTMEKAAIEGGILDKARGSVETSVGGLLRAAGFTVIRIEFR